MLERLPETATCETVCMLSRYALSTAGGLGDIAYVPDFITAEEEAHLLQDIRCSKAKWTVVGSLQYSKYAEPWNFSLNHRFALSGPASKTQHPIYDNHLEHRGLLTMYWLIHIVHCLHEAQLFYISLAVGEHCCDSVSLYNVSKPECHPPPHTCLNVQVSGRRLQSHGGSVHAKGLIPAPMPAWMQGTCSKLYGAVPQLYGHEPPNHVLVNEYQPGEGILVRGNGPWALG